MNSQHTGRRVRSTQASGTRFGSLPPIAWVLLLAATLRLLHLAAAMRSPTTFFPGPDEDFYLQFAAQVAEHGWRIDNAFGFMDPLYGYLAGAVFFIAGGSQFALLLLQVAVDVFTAWLIHACAVELGRPRAGLLAAGLYALCATAIMYSATFLKPTWVACFVAAWSLLALRCARDPGPLRWLLLGLLGGVGVALRSNLLLLIPLTLLLLPWIALRLGTPWRRLWGPLGGLIAGQLLPLCLFAALNASHGLGFSPLPYNGGIVLHHLYNAENPQSRSNYPAFVDHRHPLEILAGYRREAERRSGGSLSEPAIGRYWRDQAIDYVCANPGQTLQNVMRKFGEFFAAIEVPNNRALVQEARYSTVLALLPMPFAWLLALGLPGMLLTLRSERRGCLLLAPLLVCIATVSVFFAESRFRFHAVPTLALFGGLFLDRLVEWIRCRSWRPVAFAACGMLLIATISIRIGASLPPARIDHAREAWGLLRMGQGAEAEQLASEQLRLNPDDASMHEVRAYLLAARDDHAGAIAHLERALAARPNSHVALHNLALSQAAVGDHPAALRSIEAALDRNPHQDYLLLQADLLRQLGDSDRAIAIYCALAFDPERIQSHREIDRRLAQLGRSAASCDAAADDASQP